MHGKERHMRNLCSGKFENFLRSIKLIYLSKSKYLQAYAIFYFIFLFCHRTTLIFNMFLIVFLLVCKRTFYNFPHVFICINLDLYVT